MRKFPFLAALALAAFGLFETRHAGRQPDGSFLIPTGQTLTPAGEHVEVSDRPLGMARSPDGNVLAVVTGSNFNPRHVHLIDTRNWKAVQAIPVGDSFAGVAFSASGDRLYVGGGRDGDVKVLARGTRGFEPAGAVEIPGAAPSGLTLSADGRRLFVALNLKHAVAEIDLETRRVAREIAVGSYPYTAVLAGTRLYVSNWGGRRPGPHDVTYGGFPVVLDPRTGIPASGTVSVVDTAAGVVLRHIDTGLHPSGMALSPSGARLYVANANSDSLSVIDTKTNRVVKTIDVRLFRAAPLGSSPNALAFSGDGKTLYVANAANNAVAVVDPEGGPKALRGFIPTGWYPTAVVADGKRLYVANGYGFGSIAPPREKGRSYRDRVGVVSALDMPPRAQLEGFTRQVMRNNRVGQSAAGRLSPVRHVFYIIKENRTYDQVFGDLPQGNGDASLVQFGREVTPNHHALAERYVLLDNYYAPGDQSALGHRWCTQGYASDWLHKYGNGRNDANPMLFAPTDFLWDNARAHGLSVRSYGERGKTAISPANAGWLDIYKDWKSGARKIAIRSEPVVLGLRDIYPANYPAFDMKVTDQLRVDEFLKEFREFERNGNLPRLVVLLLPQNHTSGTAPGYPTPRACVADNDLALGRVVEAISRSRYWSQSVIFVTEDDAQNGTDHVEGHRTVGMAIGPWVRRKAVDSTFYTTINMYRTIEQILGLPPTNQFDLAADPMFSVFTGEPDFSPYAALPNRVPLDEMNPPLAGLRGLPRRLAAASLAMDFSEPDAADEETLNLAIWHSVKGYAKPFPRR
ncbi:MAG: bifunctional YncE family protein/alkaline phosphatase family protein [Bryobacteraceae bacterium]